MLFKICNMSNILLWHPTCTLDAPNKIVHDSEVNMQKVLYMYDTYHRNM